MSKYDIDGHLYWAPTRKLGGGWICHKDSPSAPTAPDPYKTANAQTQSNQQTAAYNAGLNRVNQNTPYGSITYSHTAQPGAFDQQGYDAAMAKYNASQNQGGGGYQVGSDGSVTGGPQMGGGGAAPTREQFTSGAGPDQWTANTQLSPQQQALLNQSTNLSYLRGTTANDEAAHAQNLFSAPVNFDSSPALKSNVSYGGIQNDLDTSNVPKLVGGDQLASDLSTQRNALYNQQTAYLDPQYQNQQHDLETQLQNQGINQTTAPDAYNRAMDEFGRQKTFAYNQAANSAITGGGAEQSRLFGLGLASNQNQFNQNLQAGQFHNEAQGQGFGQSMANAQLQNASRLQANSELLSQRNQTMSEINQNGAAGQPTNPQFSAVPGSNMAGTDVAGLVNQNYANQMGGYNSQVAQNNSLTNGLFSLGGAALMAPAGAISGIFSDRRLKTGIQRIGTHRLGIGVYSFKYVWGEPSVGVMADEVERVMPAAVSTHSSGFKTVDYGML